MVKLKIFEIRYFLSFLRDKDKNLTVKEKYLILYY